MRTQLTTSTGLAMTWSCSIESQTRHCIRTRDFGRQLFRSSCRKIAFALLTFWGEQKAQGGLFWPIIQPKESLVPELLSERIKGEAATPNRCQSEGTGQSILSHPKLAARSHWESH